MPGLIVDTKLAFENLKEVRRLFSRIRPKLWMQHPNFFVAYMATATVLHLGLGISQITDRDRYANPAFARVYDALPIQIWAWASIFVFVSMLVGMYYNFPLWGRLGLSAGLFLCLARGLLIELGHKSGGGLFVWIPLAVLHYAQLAEPTTNPLTAKV